MSYILEALKKAQAERQLGNAPTLHAPTLQSVARSTAGGRLKKPLLLVIAAMAVAIAALVAMVLRPAAAPAPAPVAQATVGAPAQSAPVAPAVPAAAQPSAPVVADGPAPLPAPVAALPPPVATLTPAVRRHADPQAAPTPAAGDPAAPAANAATAAATATGAAGAPAKAPAFEEPVQNLRDLPEPIQRSIPQVAVGGYIYSKNPADRLLLIDKVLRREGDEVAPGLKLEKLLPKEAVFNFKGYRYRVPY
jgi:general secretion pathway protein B